MDYRLIRARRKTLAIHIAKDASVEVRAPLRLSQSAIDDFVRQKQGWIVKHRAEMLRRLQVRPALFALDFLPLLGAQYPVNRAPVKKAEFDGRCFTLPEGDFEAVKPAAEALYREIARAHITARVAHFAPQMGVLPSAVKVNGAAARWGSCSAKNSLNFSWRLVLTPPEAVDYVVVHELAHIHEHNHSVAFWRVVQCVLPDYKQRQALLRQARQWGE